MINKTLFFENLHEFWRYSSKDSAAHNTSSRSNRDIEWHGGLTWEEAKEMAINGWYDGMKEIERFRAQLFPFIAEKVLRPQQLYSVTGYSVDVGSYLANDPECFISREYEERNYPGRIFKVVCSISFSASITPETIIQRGAMICALIDAIEFAGHRAEVVCNDAACYYDDEEDRRGENKESGWFEVSVVVKKSTQALEMTDLAFCLAHPAMLRRIMFSAAEIEGWSDYARNYGYPAEATVKGDIYIREIFSGTVPDEKAIMWVLDELTKLGINLEITD